MRRHLLYLALAALVVLTAGASSTFAARGSGNILYLFNGRLLAEAGNSATLSVTRSRSGKRNANRMARILLARGIIPHNNPSQGAGIVSDSNFLAGGTSSFDHTVMVPES